MRWEISGRSTSWKECSLGDVITLQRGFDLPERDRQKGTIPIISSSGITGYHSIAKVKGPGVVTGRYGTLGEVFYIPGDFWPLNTTLFVRDFKGNDPLFISHFLKTLNLANQSGASAVPGVNRNALHLLRVRVPPLPTQRKIADILSAYDDLIENNTRRIAILEEMARSLHHEWFVKFRFPGYEQAKMVESELGMIPEGWEVVRFFDIAEVLSGGTPKTTISDYWNGDIPFYTPKDAPTSFFTIETEKTITEQGLRACNSSLYPPNTVFITARGTVGRIALNAVGMAMNQSCYALRGREGISQLFIFMHLRNCIRHLKQTATGAVFETIVVDTFKWLQVVKPPQEQIDAFTKEVSPIFAQILNLTRRNLLLRRTRDLLLPKLISGEIDVSTWVEGEVGDKVQAAMATTVAEQHMHEPRQAEPIDPSSLVRRSLWE